MACLFACLYANLLYLDTTATPYCSVSVCWSWIRILWQVLFKLFNILPFQVTVMHSMQAGYMDKAQKYTDKALMQIEKLKSEFIFWRMIDRLRTFVSVVVADISL